MKNSKKNKAGIPARNDVKAAEPVSAGFMSISLTRDSNNHAQMKFSASGMSLFEQLGALQSCLDIVKNKLSGSAK